MGNTFYLVKKAKESRRNKNFVKNEKKIQLAMDKYFAECGDVRNVHATEIYRIAKISRSTFQRHVRDVNRIIEVENTMLAESFTARIEQGHRELTIDDIMKIFIIFVVQNKLVFEARCRMEDKVLLGKMINEMRKFLIKYKVCFADDDVFEVYVAVMMIVINRWEREGINFDNIHKIIKKLVFVTENFNENFMMVKVLKG